MKKTKKKAKAKRGYLVIVESPTKARTISKILGRKYQIFSSMGHMVDLPSRKLGIDLKNNFEPTYVVITKKKKTLSELKKKAASKERVYLATDYDREGEAISWHIRRQFKDDSQQFSRVVFHEITPEAIKEAFDNPHEIDMNLVNAQQARRILDRLVGYKLSPLLWRKVVRGLSAGRVQSVALRLIVERERLIRAHIPKEYWEIEAELAKINTGASSFTAKLSKIDNKKAELKNEKSAQGITERLKNESFVVKNIKQAERKRRPSPPFITSSLQQDAFNKLRFSTSKTMMLAQQLYEGVELGESGPVGLITYMRTDSFNIAASALSSLRQFILKEFGKEYLPAKPNVYKSKKLAQEAHEAIRPSSVNRRPEDIQGFLTPDQLKLYELIYRRFIASQMMPARYLQKTVEIEAGNCIFSSSGLTVLFKGFKIVYDDPEKESLLPEFSQGEKLQLIKLSPTQHFTNPPARFSEGSLVKALEEEGIGRPSTYSPIIYTLVMRNYVRRTKGYLRPSELGEIVSDILVENFPEVMDIGFTAQMEAELDEVEEGKIKWVDVVKNFYKPFSKALEIADKTIKKEVVFTDQICDQCGKPFIIKWGRRGKFLSCSAFPECKNALSITTGVKCPQEGCLGELIERKSRRGMFYGCTKYPECKYTANALPEPQEKDTKSSETDLVNE